MDTERGNEHFSVAVHFLRLLTSYLEQHGCAAQELLSQAGISHDSLCDPNGRIPFVSFDHLCKLAADELNDPFLGLKLGLSVRPGHLGSYGFALMACSTGHELMQQAARYSVLAIDAGHHVVEIRGAECLRHWRSSLPHTLPLGRIQDELNLATWVTLARWFYNRQDLRPNWVAFQHSRPDDTSPYDRLFRCPITFDAAETTVAFDANYLLMDLPLADDKLRRIMNDVCEQLLKQMGDALEPSWLAIARRTVLDSFSKGEPSLLKAAKSAGLTEAEFKEHLAHRGLSFRRFVDELRSSLAVGYARDPSLGLVDIAYLLGFSEQSAFQRAFKRWTKMTPGQYRRNHSS
ncbi:AraC family transcriptional regulator [Pseudomonas sp. UL073]|uniref:AraC family transcriptional regulator n=1 Tax=Zestomonas insulae TaxID=2809017 RepID=A0ABS2IC25_9GAMM|nr:AraC family transcriptional regulator [Pseudomonas insulae]MBM7060664.1 AraC family transcriptional regulator [Pseudomonas insulae]